MTKKTLCFDSEKCVGCHACVVACADQNDIDVLAGQHLRRRVEHYESDDAGEVRIAHVSLGCMQCEAAECLDACPSGALRRDAASGAMMLTPLAVALVLVETTDLIFAVDSIPAIFAITADPFLVATSNVFAILGLHSLYFALAGAIDKFHYLKYSLALILALVGAKMLTAEWLKEQFGPNVNFYLLGMVGLLSRIVRTLRR